MGKLSNLTINKTLCLRDINFDGFSLSKNWVGFFERENSFDFNLVDEAIELFIDFFKDELDGFFAISSLSFNDEAEYDQEVIDKYSDIYEEAKKEGYLKPLSDSFESYRFGDDSLQASDVSIHFDNRLFMDVSRLIMSHGGVNGQVFFMINLKLGVAIYPHDDTGFGCLSLNGKNETCINFLNYIKKNSVFKVTFNSKL